MVAPIDVDPYSACAFPVSMMCGDEQLGSATGFFWRLSGRLYLVSNWHVFSGRAPATGQPINRDGAIPDTLFAQVGLKVAGQISVFDLHCPLYAPNGESLWLHHSVHGQAVDVACLDCSSIFTQVDQFESIFCINEMPSVEGEIEIPVGSDVFVLGFPLNIKQTGILPVWKRASVATEFDYPISNLPSFLIDTATREGMSGAPVILRSTSFMSKAPRAHNTGPPRTKFLGVYSGRHVGRMDEAQLGIVWKAVLIEEMITMPSAGSYDIRSAS